MTTEERDEIPDDDLEDDEEEAGAEGKHYQPAAKSKMSIGELMEKDAEDESLRRYKEALLGSAATGEVADDASDPRQVIVLQFAVHIDGREPLIFSLDSEEKITELKHTPFVLKEGCTYKFSIQFKVQHNIVTGLAWRNAVYKAGIKVFTQKEMIGSYAPGTTHEWESQLFEAPTGWLARSSYKGRQKFVDDDGASHLRFEYCFEIKKDW
eukprot:NODE_1527_length_865_cov_252.017157_g1186_i0.p1 GENE.NODE_1527_length_865_cov_252.017157_g1186_i0~~NODE_1527_length_865_cov_252.017157_g1186_i0.p1  ORF type:complete len:210 (+),score=45.67 NODE_1527_length_865_cov_252.017157_g1186_i0:97-726(+)